MGRGGISHRAHYGAAAIFAEVLDDMGSLRIQPVCTKSPAATCSSLPPAPQFRIADMVDPQAFQRRHWIPMTAFVICALAMGLLWQAIDARIRSAQHDQFGADIHLITTRISE